MWTPSISIPVDGSWCWRWLIYLSIYLSFTLVWVWLTCTNLMTHKSKSKQQHPESTNSAKAAAHSVLAGTWKLRHRSRVTYCLLVLAGSRCYITHKLYGKWYCWRVVDLQFRGYWKQWKSRSWAEAGLGSASHLPRSPGIIIWYWPGGGDFLRLDFHFHARTIYISVRSHVIAACLLLLLNKILMLS